MNIALAGDGRCITQALRRLFGHVSDGHGPLLRGQRKSGMRAVPCAEGLGAGSLTADVRLGRVHLLRA